MLELKNEYYHFLNWHQWYFLASVILLAIASIGKGSFFGLIGDNINLLIKLKDDKDTKFWNELPSYVFSFMHLSLFFFLTYEYYNDRTFISQVHIFSAIMVLTILFSMQWLVEKLVIYVSEYNELGALWQSSKWGAVKLLGILMFVLNLFLIYLPSFLQPIMVYTAIAVYLLVGVFLFVRLLTICSQYPFSYWYIILYFCALEIIPISLLLRRFVS